MKAQRIFFLLAAPVLLLCIFTHAQSRKKQATNLLTLTGDSSLFKPSPFVLDSNPAFVFRYQDRLGLRHHYFKLTRDTPGAVFEIENGWLGNYPVYPGETIRANADEYANIYFTVPDNEARNNEYMFLLKYTNLRRERYNGFFGAYRPAIAVLNESNHPAEILPTLLPGYMRAMRSGLDSLAMAYHIQPELINKTILQLSADSLATVINFYVLYRASVVDEQKRERILTDQIKSLNNSVDTGNLVYHQPKIDEMLDLLLHQLHISTLIRKSEELPRYYDVIKKYFSGTSRNYLLSWTLETFLISQRLEIPDAYWADYKQTCDDQQFVEVVAADLAEAKRTMAKTGSPKVDGLLGMGKTKTITLDALFKSHKGQVLLVDFWASWCVPCRKEMPAKRQLADNYAGKPITWINISLDKVMDDWKTASSEEKMAPENSFLLINPQLSTYINRFSIRSIPRYMIIGKDGTILLQDAPGPGDPKLKNILDRLLAE